MLWLSSRGFDTLYPKIEYLLSCTLKRFMPFLQKADVQITEIAERYFMLSTNYDNYTKVRSYLCSMRDDFGLNTMFISEETTALSSINDRTIIEKGSPPRAGNDFMIRGVYLVGQDKEKMLGLANEVAEILRSKGLSVKVHVY